MNGPTTLYPTESARDGASDLPAGTRRVPRLAWTDARGERTVTVEKCSIVGSAPHCDIIIADPAVSRVHAEIQPRDDGLWIRDLKSLNGTFVQGVPVDLGCVLHGFTLRVGTTEIRVDYESGEGQAVAVWHTDEFGPLVGRSRPMRELFSTLSRLAPLDASVLVQGETGSGKELVARAIHEKSARASRPFVVVDCAALSESLIEAELFGHAKGAFTGAHQIRVGAIEAADGGTVFLDEIGELRLSMQPKLLRVLESGTIRRIGESKYRDVNVRFLSATHRDLLSMVHRGEFREDLYFRLAVVFARLPSLRERVEDIGPLLNRFSGGPPRWLTPTWLRSLESRPWRGNVRELRNFAAQARALGPAVALALHRNSADAEKPPSPAIAAKAPIGKKPDSAGHDRGPAEPSSFQPFSDFREKWILHGERAFLQALLARHKDNVAAAAKEAELDRTYIYKLLRKHGM